MIAANIQIERPASLSDLVDSVRCISTWSLGKVSTTSNSTRKMKPHTVALVRSKLKSNRCILFSAMAVEMNSPTPPCRLQMMKPIAKIAPPIFTITCTKSVQITAFMPPIAV